MKRVKRQAGFDDRIRAGYARNEPVRQIAATLGVTRNVVIGRARILGLSNPERWLQAVHSQAQSAILAEAWRKRPEESRQRIHKAAGDGLKAFWASLSPEEKRARIDNLQAHLRAYRRAA